MGADDSTAIDRKIVVGSNLLRYQEFMFVCVRCSQ